MLILTCPCCGLEAAEIELAPGGEAHLKRFGPGSSDAELERYLFTRHAAKGPVLERWRHAYGCGKWFLAARDSVTMEVYGTYSARLPEPPEEVLARIRARHPGWQVPA
ncbi:sarcosine oxidase subunit delta [Yangia mangrovi]|uniref:Sarcosine oxidase subunit delta n=1 Tax=Alloyangia mangrovi TaxID=1779329 RepID=A0ABT2KFY5_9RHOB|nr:sarcosine oxidase subunit delta [Alloyangia mangrovi]MCT4369280.1 sarcosine oxidase subunit delta [Alloyangia mangrovi]